MSKSFKDNFTVSFDVAAFLKEHGREGTGVRNKAQPTGMAIANPLVIMFEQGDHVVCHIHTNATYNSHEPYGLLICDLVRHVANAFDVEEDDVWEWVDKERRNPTTDIKQPS